MSTGPTDFTISANRSVLDQLPFGDEQDFEDANRGLIASYPDRLIKTEKGRVVWDGASFDFVAGDAPDSVNPSLWRQARLNNIHGLFMVTDGIYQVRGYDIANITFIEGDTGWIVVDALISAELSRKALEFVNQHLGERPVSGVIITHSHADHFGGIRGIISEKDIVERGIEVVAPAGFLYEAASENVMAGAAMRRRATYMYGSLLPRGPEGLVDVGLGITTSSGSVGLMAPTRSISETGTEMKIDGKRFIFQYTPESEAPAEMMFYLPDMKAFCSAEIITHVMHNVYTPRGAQVRDALAWAKYIHEAMELFGDAEVLFAVHHWPTWGNERVIEFMGQQRDLYKYMHDETLRLANQGATMVEIAELIELPQSLSRLFAGRDYYGTLNHNVKAIYQFYFGWFDGNPANLHPLPPDEASIKYVEFMGGADSVLEKARGSFDKGEYRWVAQVLNHLVFALPEHAQGKALLAETYRQLGYQAESGPWRNFYLTGAQELEQGAPQLPTGRMGGADTINALTIDMFLDYLAIRLHGPRAAEVDLSFHLRFTDPDVNYLLTVTHGVLNYRVCEPDTSVGTSLILSRDTWNKLALGGAIDQLVASGELSVEGDVAVVVEFFSLLDEFNMWFNIVTP